MPRRSFNPPREKLSKGHEKGTKVVLFLGFRGVEGVKIKDANGLWREAAARTVSRLRMELVESSEKRSRSKIRNGPPPSSAFGKTLGERRKDEGLASRSQDALQHA